MASWYVRQKLTGLSIAASDASVTDSKPMIRVEQPASRKRSSSSSSLATFNVVSADQDGISPALASGIIARSSSLV